jgi:hypothetical protein
VPDQSVGLFASEDSLSNMPVPINGFPIST